MRCCSTYNLSCGDECEALKTFVAGILLTVQLPQAVAAASAYACVCNDNITALLWAVLNGNVEHADLIVPLSDIASYELNLLGASIVQFSLELLSTVFINVSKGYKRASRSESSDQLLAQAICTTCDDHAFTSQL